MENENTGKVKVNLYDERSSEELLLLTNDQYRLLEWLQTNGWFRSGVDYINLVEPTFTEI